MKTVFIFLFTFLLSSQLGKHFFFPFSYLSGIRIDYLAPTIYVTDILSLVCVYYFILRCVIPAKAGIQTIILQFKKGNLRLDPLLRGDDNTIYFIFLYLLILLLCVNFAYSLSKPLWIYNFLRIIQWASIFYYFKLKANSKSFFSAAILGLLFSGIMELALSLMQLASRHSIQGWWYYLGERSFSVFTPGIAKAYFLGHEFLRPYGTFSHPNSLAGFYLLLYTFILTQKRITNTILKIILLTLFSFLIFISFSRTTIVVYIVVNLVYFFKSSFNCRMCFFAKIVTACALLFFAFNVSGDLQSMEKRSDFAQKAVAIITERPFSGVGIGSYLIAQHNYPQKFSTFFEQPVHNIFLLAIAQLGIPLSILLMILIIPTSPFGLRGTSRIFRTKLKTIEFLLPLLVIVLTGFMDHYWLTLQQNVLLTAVAFGMMNSYETKAV